MVATSWSNYECLISKTTLSNAKKSALFTTLGALSLLRRAWSMAGSTIKFTLEISLVQYLYFAVCILCFVFYILNVVFCSLYCFCIQHHQVHLGAPLSGLFVFCVLYLVFYI